MTFLAPGFLAATLVLGLATIAMHLIAWRRPDDLLLPTARFVPEQASRRAARALRPTDLPLLFLRLAILGLVGVALAQPVITPRRAGVARVVAVDRSGAISRFAEARDSALAFTEGAQVAEAIVFDSAAAALSLDALRSLSDSTGGTNGSLSAGLVLLIRRAEALLSRHERVELAIVSAFAREELDAATLALRDLWADSVRLIHVAAARAPVTARMEVRAAADDPVAAGIHLALSHGMVDRSRDVRVVRASPSAADSAWARAGGVLVHWPDSSGTAAVAPDDRPNGVLVGDRAVLGPVREMALADEGIVMGHWLDGAPAVRQIALGDGCTRIVGFDVARDGDLALTVAFRRVAAALLAPCGGVLDRAPLSDSVLSRLAAGATEHPASRATRRAETADARIRAALLVAALILGLVELLVRRSSAPVRDVAPRGEAAAAT